MADVIVGATAIVVIVGKREDGTEKELRIACGKRQELAFGTSTSEVSVTYQHFWVGRRRWLLEAR